MNTDALGEALPLAHARAPQPGEAAPLIQALSAPLTSGPSAALGERLRLRVAASHAAQAGLLTRRRPQSAAAQSWGAGLRAWPLREQSWVVELDPLAVLSLAQPGDNALELLVLAGQGQFGTDADAQALRASHHLLLTESQAPLLQAGATGLRLYLRRHGPQGPFRAPQQAQVQAPQAWQPLRPGVEICPLHAEGQAISLLARLDSGGRVPAHPHGVDEECLMVEGELFLGDLLLREGEYQFAPAGSQHGELFADAPCLLFFHGAIDAAAIDNPYRQAQGWPPL
ncbi:hypothetical protein HNQ51_001882 [Inhella inkyongensis]|uniref:ChrR-like cupin domain-containing protein n=1 Tax=Inhella inkyongensis TaxID=392593 RepID=A0A840S515_9BURK|nr:cupin domain-containing protein [Inhella inkyongensis]MBB5204568.1 hypothetical protein [Inhella inkyongensis]